MLQNMNQWAKGWLAWIIVGGLAIVFTLWGISDFISPNPRHQAAARVNGETISMQEFQLVYDRMLKQQQQFFASNKLMGWEIDEKILKKEALQTLIDEKLLIQAVTKRGFAISDEQLNRYILAFPEFHEDGHFSNARFQQIAQQMSMTSNQLKQKFHEYLLVGQLRNGIMDSTFLPDPLLDDAITLLEQRRDAGFAVLPISRYFDKVTVNDADMKAFYEEHKQEFMYPEQVQLEYLILSANDLAKDIKIDEQEIEGFYHTNIKDFSTDEERRAAHILIELPQDANQKDVDNATQTLKDYAEQIKAGKADFATLAKEHSQDSGSNTKGGDLGWFNASSEDSPLKAYIFQLGKVGEISDPIRTKYGVHLIMLTDLKPAVVKPLNEVKDSIIQTIKHDKQNELFVQKVDELSTMAYEHPDSLELPAHTLGLPLQKTDWITQQGTIDGITADPQVIRVAFGNEVLLDKQNSELIDLGEDKVMILRVSAHKPAAIRSFDEVKEDVKQLLVQQKAADQVKQQGEAMIAELGKGANPQALATIANVTWQEQSLLRHTNGVDPLIIRQVFSLKTKSLPSINGFSLPNGDYVVTKLTAVQPGKVDDNMQRQAYQDQLTELLSYTDYNLYTRGLLDHAKIDIKIKD